MIEQFHEVTDYKLKFDKFPLSVILIDNDFIILDCNSTFCEMFGWSKKELISKNLLNNILFSEDYIIKLIKKFQNITYIKKNYPIAVEIYKKNGYRKSVEILINQIKISNYNAFQIIFYTNRIKEGFVKNQELSQSKYLERIDIFNEGYYEIDLQGNFNYVNKQFCSMLGYSSNEISNSNILDYIKAPELLQKRLNLVSMNMKPNPSLKLKLIPKNKESISFDISINPERNDKNEIIGFYGIIRDIRDKETIKKLTYENEDFRQKTIELEKLLKNQQLFLDELSKASQFKSEFLATMSHELRTPLNAIIGFSELITAECMEELSDEFLDYITEIHDSGIHLLELINDILDIQKIESGKLEIKYQLVSLNSILKNIESSFRPNIEDKGLYFKLIGFDEDKKILIDPLKFKQILFNLISNSVKYTMQGGIKVKIKENEAEWEIEVKDTGIGIEEKDYNLVFQEFKRCRNSVIYKIPGTGLGLPLTKRLVELHGGKIVFKSEYGQGTSFKVTLPKVN